MAHELYKSLDRYLQSTEFTVLEDTMVRLEGESDDKETIRQEISILRTKMHTA